jgi:predicted metal-dependent hydrolase
MQLPFPFFFTDRLGDVRQQTPDAARLLQLDDGPLAYRLVRSRRRTLAIHIRPDDVEVRAPLRTSIADIEGFMREKARWIRRRLAESHAVAPFRWEDGARLPLLGNEVVLTDAPGRLGIALEDGKLLIGHGRRGRGDKENRSEDRARDWRARVIKWIRERALAYFSERVARFAAALDVAHPVLRLSNAATQWGSCIRNASGTRVLLHWKLYLMPPALIDYVVAHELAHLRELNHSVRFWAQVARVYPEPVAARRELNRRGRLLPKL